jgi:hypothetical protein
MNRNDLRRLIHEVLDEAPDNHPVGKIWLTDSGKYAVKVIMGGSERIEYFDTPDQARTFRDQMLDSEGRPKAQAN